jgi:RNA polymerase sporulation-specific sigma factor
LKKTGEKPAGVRIANEILMMLRTQKKYNREVSLFEPIGTDKEGNMISLVDVIEADEKEVWDQMMLEEDILRVREVLKDNLQDKEKTVILMRYGLADGKEYTQREIAEQLGISRSYVSRIEKAALGKMRKEMEKPEQKK